MKTILALLTFMLVLVSPTSTSSPIAISVDPVFQYAPGRVDAVAVIEPHRDNVAFCIGWESVPSPDGQLSPDRGSYRSCQLLNGIYSPTRHYFQWRNLDYGRYLAYAELYRVPARLAAHDTKTFQVLEGIPK